MKLQHINDPRNSVPVIKLVLKRAKSWFDTVMFHDKGESVKPDKRFKKYEDVAQQWAVINCWSSTELLCVLLGSIHIKPCDRQGKVWQQQFHVNEKHSHAVVLVSVPTKQQ